MTPGEIAFNAVMSGGLIFALVQLYRSRSDKRKTVSEADKLEAETDQIFLNTMNARVTALAEDNVILRAEVKDTRTEAETTRRELRELQRYADLLHRLLRENAIPLPSLDEFTKRPGGPEQF